jgi:hypothetical protein
VEAEPKVEPSVTTDAAPVVTIETADPDVSVTYVEAAPAAEAEEECEIYCKHVEGKLWIEGTAGPARYNMTQFRTFNVLPDGVGTLTPKVIVSGAEYGAGIGAQFDLVSVGGRFKYGKFGDFDLLSAGLDYSFVGLFISGDEPTGERFEYGVVGGAIAGTFALTVHAR